MFKYEGSKRGVCGKSLQESYTFLIDMGTKKKKTEVLMVVGMELCINYFRFFGINIFLSLLGFRFRSFFSSIVKKGHILMHARYHGFCLKYIRLLRFIRPPFFWGFEYAWCFVCTRTTSLYIAETT